MTQPPRPPAGESLPERLAARVEAIVRAAEQEAGAVQREIEAQRRVADAEARHYAEQTRRRIDAAAEERLQRIRAVTDGLAERAEQVGRELDGLAGAIGALSAELATVLPEPQGYPGPATDPDPAGAPTARAPDLAPEWPAWTAPGAGTAGERNGEPSEPSVDPRDAAAPVASPPSLRIPPGSPGPAPGPGPAGIAAAHDLPPGVRRRAVTPASAAAGSAERRPGRDTATDPPSRPSDAANGRSVDGAAWAPDATDDALDPPAGVPGRGRARRAPHPGDRIDAGRLVALEMAVAGRTRDNVDEHLREVFGIGDPAGILDDVFGPPAGSPRDPARHA